MDKLPEKLVYAIRLPQLQSRQGWLTDSLFLPSLTKSSRNRQDVPASPPYDDSCFLVIQNDIERAYIAAITNQPAPSTSLHRFPYPAVIEDSFTVIAGASFPMLFVLCLMLSAKNIIKVSILFLHFFSQIKLYFRITF